ISVDEKAFYDPRSLELINKTNQFNLTGERITNEDWLRWQSQKGTLCLSAKLTDRYGDFGTVSVITGRCDDGVLSIRNMVLSCRSFGRGVEYLLLQHAL